MCSGSQPLSISTIQYNGVRTSCHTYLMCGRLSWVSRRSRMQGPLSHHGHYGLLCFSVYKGSCIQHSGDQYSQTCNCIYQQLRWGGVHGQLNTYYYNYTYNSFISSSFTRLYSTGTYYIRQWKLQSPQHTLTGGWLTLYR